MDIVFGYELCLCFDWCFRILLGILGKLDVDDESFPASYVNYTGGAPLYAVN